jgi:hypothetical protein
MQLVEELDSKTMERLGKQGKFLLRLYQAELAKDPTSPGTASSRSNLMVVQHTIKQMYANGDWRGRCELHVKLGVIARRPRNRFPRSLLPIWHKTAAN